jgi:hypothetical protein
MDCLLFYTTAISILSSVQTSNLLNEFSFFFLNENLFLITFSHEILSFSNGFTSSCFFFHLVNIVKKLHVHARLLHMHIRIVKQKICDNLTCKRSNNLLMLMLSCYMTTYGIVASKCS